MVTSLSLLLLIDSDSALSSVPWPLTLLLSFSWLSSPICGPPAAIRIKRRETSKILSSANYISPVKWGAFFSSLFLSIMGTKKEGKKLIFAPRQRSYPNSGAIKDRGSRIRCNFCESLVEPPTGERRRKRGLSGHKSRPAIKAVKFRPSVSHGPFVQNRPVTRTRLLARFAPVLGFCCNFTLSTRKRVLCFLTSFFRTHKIRT